MRLNLTLLSFTVHADYISVKAVVNNPGNDTVNLLKEIKGKKKKIQLENVGVIASIESINVNKRISVIIHTEKERYAAICLYELSEQKKAFNLYIKSDTEIKLQYLLKQVSAKTGRPQEDILEQVSAFPGKDGAPVMGRRSIFELTVPWQKTVENKLLGMLKGQPE